MAVQLTEGEVVEIRRYLSEAGCTYPLRLLRRRLGLLTSEEKRRVMVRSRKIAALAEKADELAVEVDEIIGTRAEIAEDPWK